MLIRFSVKKGKCLNAEFILQTSSTDKGFNFKWNMMFLTH